VSICWSPCASTIVR